MRETVRVIVHDYGWIHTSLGLLGNFTFLVGSVLFLPYFEPWKVLGVWLFIVGAFFMVVGSIGNLLVGVMDERDG